MRVIASQIGSGTSTAPTDASQLTAKLGGAPETGSDSSDDFRTYLLNSDPDEASQAASDPIATSSQLQTRKIISNSTQQMLLTAQDLESIATGNAPQNTKTSVDLHRQVLRNAISGVLLLRGSSGNPKATQRGSNKESPEPQQEQAEDTVDAGAIQLPTPVIDANVSAASGTAGSNAISHDSYNPSDASSAIGRVAASSVANDPAVAMKLSNPDSHQGQTPQAADANTESPITSQAPALSSQQALLHAALVSGPKAATGKDAEAPISGNDLPASSRPQPSATKEGEAVTPSTKFEAVLDKVMHEPVRGAHVQVNGVADQKVDIRLFERNGILSLTVRANDNGLARSLQDHMPELTSRLETQHFRTETWMPSSEANEQRGSRGGHGAEDSQSGARQQNQNRQQGGSEQDVPEWVKETEAQKLPFFETGVNTWQQ